MLSLFALSDTWFGLVQLWFLMIPFFVTILWKMLSWTALVLIYRSTGTKYWLQVFLLWAPLLASSEVSPHHSSLEALWLCKSPVSLKGLLCGLIISKQEKKKYNDGFFFWKPPRKFGELWAFLFLPTPSTLVPVSSLQKELRDHRALLVSQRQLSFLAAEGRAAINQTGSECISVACSVGWGQGTEETTYRWGSCVSHEKRGAFSTSQEGFTSRREGVERLGAF